jgi:hypothetical protein
MTEFIIAFYGIASIAAAIAALVIAPRRGRNGQSWAFWSFLFPPLALYLYYVRPRERPSLAVSVKSGGEKDHLIELL